MRAVNASAPDFEGGMDRIENVTGDDGRSAETVRQRIEAVQQVSTFLNEWIPVVKKCAYGVALQLEHFQTDWT